MDYTEIEQVVFDEWIIAKMQEFGLKRKDLTQELGLDKSYLSLLFAKADNPRKIHLTKAMKGLLYYYFRTKDLENKITS